MSSASTKFALVAIAEKKEIALEPLLDELGPREAIEAPPERVLQRRPTLALTDRGGRPTPLATALTPAAEASTSAAAPAAKEPEKEVSPSSVVPAEKKEGKKKASPPAGARKASSASKTSSPSGARKSSASPAGARKARRRAARPPARGSGRSPPTPPRRATRRASRRLRRRRRRPSRRPPPRPSGRPPRPSRRSRKPEAKPLGGIKSFREPNGRRASRLVALVSEDQVPAEVHSMVEQTFESVWVSILPFDDPAEAEARGAPAGSAVALDFAFRTTEAPLDAMGAALQKAGALEAEGKMTEAAEVMAGAMEAAAASIQARHRGKLTRQATSQKLAEARMSGVKQ